MGVYIVVAISGAWVLYNLLYEFLPSPGEKEFSENECKSSNVCFAEKVK